MKEKYIIIFTGVFTIFIGAALVAVVFVALPNRFPFLAIRHSRS